MAAPLRGTQSLVGQMGWVFGRPWLTAIEVCWRWVFGIPFLALCWMHMRWMAPKLELNPSPLAGIDAQNPWLAAEQLSQASAGYRTLVLALAIRLLPVAALAWPIVSGLGRGLLLKRMEPTLRFRPLSTIALQAAWLAFFALTVWGWLLSMEWAAATHITPNAEPDLIGFSIWVIVLSLAFFTAWALASWPLTMAPLLMLLEERSALSALGQSLRLGKAFTGKLVEINLVMGIVKLALIVLAMVLSAAPLPFSDQLGSGAMHGIFALAALFYLVASDYFQVVRLKSFVEFWKMFRGGESV